MTRVGDAPVDPARSGRRHAGRRATRWSEALIVLVVLLALVWVQLDLGTRLGGGPVEDPVADPAAVAPPPGLRLPDPVVASAVAAPLDVRGAVSAKVRAAAAPYVSDKLLGPDVDVVVSDLDSGRVLYRSGTGRVTPASTTKLLTGTAALEILGPQRRLATTVRRVGATRQVVLVGGGDPFLASTPQAAVGLYPARADLTTLARSTAATLRRLGLRRVRVGYDATLFSGPSVSPDWPPDYLTDAVVPPITALWVDEGRDPSGRGFVVDPTRRAAAVFRVALRAEGIRVPSPPVFQRAPEASTEIASVRSAPLEQVVQRTLAVSDNNAAEVLAHLVGRAETGAGSFAGGAAGVRAVLGRLGVDLGGDRLVDGSGLSRRNLLSPLTVLHVLETAASREHPELRAVVTGLPVAGFSGSLRYRFDTGKAAGRGRVRAKTGTLTGVHGLAGIATDLQGHRLAFIALADKVDPVDTLDARQRIDELAASLGACRCGP